MGRGLPLAASDILLTAPGAAAPLVQIASLALSAGDQVAITGASGSGKTSLLHCLAGIARPQRGSIAWGTDDIAALAPTACDRWRRGAVGIVFQEFHLVPELDVLANILLPAAFAGWRVSSELSARAATLAASVGLREPRRRAGLLSRGEQQRAAIARALLADPAVLLADEPTASLDRQNADALGDLLLVTARRAGATLIVVTHDDALILRIGRSWHMQDGCLAPRVPGA